MLKIALRSYVATNQLMKKNLIPYLCTWKINCPQIDIFTSQYYRTGLCFLSSHLHHYGESVRLFVGYGLGWSPQS